MGLSAHSEQETGTPGEENSQSCRSGHGVQVSELTLSCLQVDHFCAEVFCQGWDVHLHWPSKDGGVEELAAGNTEREWLLSADWKTLQQQNEGKQRSRTEILPRKGALLMFEWCFLSSGRCFWWSDAQRLHHGCFPGDEHVAYCK